MVFSELQADFPMGANSTLCRSLTTKDLTGQGKPLLTPCGKYFAALATLGCIGTGCWPDFAEVINFFATKKIFQPV